MLTKNLKATDSEIEEINEAFPIPDSVREFRIKELELFKKYGVNGPADTASFEEEKKLAFDEEYATLNQENADTIEEFKAYEKEKLEFLGEEIEFSLHTIKVDDVPDISAENTYPHWEIWNILEKIVVE